MVEAAVVIIALSAMVLVAYLIPTLRQLAKTAEQSERLMRMMNTDVPPLLEEAGRALHTLNLAAIDIEKALAGGRALNDAAASITCSITDVRSACRRTANELLTGIVGWADQFRPVAAISGRGGLSALLTGVQEGFKFMRGRSAIHTRGGSYNGGEQQ